MNRAQFRKIARIRLREAERLLQARMFDGSYYLAGYAVECGLKACVARLTRKYDFPGKDFARNAYTHDFAQLIKIAELADRYREDTGQNLQLAANWTIVKDWKEDSRYARWTALEARELFEAIADVPDGVFSWIEQHW